MLQAESPHVARQDRGCGSFDHAVAGWALHNKAVGQDLINKRTWLANDAGRHQWSRTGSVLVCQVQRGYRRDYGQRAEDDLDEGILIRFVRVVKEKRIQ